MTKKSEYMEKIREVIPRAQQALRDVSRILGQGNVRHHADITWGAGLASAAVREADQAERELHWIDCDQVASEIEKAREEGRLQALKEARKIAYLFSVKNDRSIHPDIPWDQMSELAKMVAHTTAQQIAMEIDRLINPRKEDDDE